MERGNVTAGRLQSTKRTENLRSYWVRELSVSENLKGLRYIVGRRWSNENQLSENVFLERYTTHCIDGEKRVSSCP